MVDDPNLKYLKLTFNVHRILLVGTSRSPFDAELKPFVKCYERIILIPRPDYASRYGNNLVKSITSR